MNAKRPGLPLEPTQILPSPPSEMRMSWNTGEAFTIPYTELRFQCPCASCVDEQTGQRTIKREQVGSDVRVTGVQIVGRYAAQIRFSDGHATGMYHFDRLHELCKSAGRSLY